MPGGNIPGKNPAFKYVSKNPEDRAIQCSMCGGKFFPASIVFHRKACAPKHNLRLEPCPHCEEMLPPREWQVHRDRCPHKGGTSFDRKPIMAGGGSFEATIIRDTEGIDGLDGRVACKCCGRKFNPDRVDKHETICFKSSARPARPVFDSRMQRMSGSQEFGAFPTVSPQGVSSKRSHVSTGASLEFKPSVKSARSASTSYAQRYTPTPEARAKATTDYRYGIRDCIVPGSKAAGGAAFPGARGNLAELEALSRGPGGGGGGGPSGRIVSSNFSSSDNPLYNPH